MQKSVYSICLFWNKSILESCDQTGHTHFWPCRPKEFVISFRFLWICINMQKVNLFHPFIFQIQSVLGSCDQTGYSHNKKFKSTFNFFEFLSTCKRWGCFINFFWRNNWFENPTIWLAETILVFISETRFFQNMGFVQEQSK